MADSSTALSDSQDGKAGPTAILEDGDAYRAARAQFSARRAYKRALRRARNPLYFSPRLLTLALVLVLLATSAALALIFALRGAPAAAPLAPVIEIVEVAKSDGAESDGAPLASTATPSPPAVQVILAAETPERLILEGPPIPTVIITNTPIPLAVGLRAAVYGVGVDKLNIRNSPTLGGSQVLFRESEGKLFDIIGGPQEADGFTWWQVRDPQFQVEGWAVANYLRTVSESAPN